jgi:HSP90 family molecular chaperone
MHKESHGHLEIRMSMQDNILNCTITDNGIGRVKAAELKSKSGEKQKSLGLKITAERLALINEEKGVKTNYQIEDIIDEVGNSSGTKVVLNIRYKEQIKEPAKQLIHT